MNNIYQKVFLIPILTFFILISANCFAFANWFDSKQIDHNVLLIGNLILCVITLLTSRMHVKAIQSENPHAFVRSVTAGSFIKLFVIAISVMAYLLASKTKSVYAVATCMLLYIVYTVIEVRGAMKINLQRNAKN